MKMCVYGAASDAISDQYKTAARQVGREIARTGHTMVFGGGASGVMGACARGCLDAGGEVVGVVPEFMNEFEPVCENLTRTITTKDMADRKSIMEDMADAFIILPGGVGTFDEFFQVVTLVELKQKKAKVILYNVNNYFSYIIKAVEKGIREHFIRENIGDYFVVCDTPRDISEALKD